MNIHQLLVFFLIHLSLLSFPLLHMEALALPSNADSINREQAERVSQSLAQTLMSPFCPGRTLEACPSPEARKLREEILVSLLLGKSPEQIKQELVSIYSYDILGTPEVGGFGLLGWALPPLFLILGLGGIVLFIKRLKKVSRKTLGPQDVFHANAEYDNKQANDEITAEVQRRMRMD